MELFAVFLPLFAFITAGLFGKQIGDKGCQYITTGAVIIAALCSIMLFFEIAMVDHQGYTSVLANWVTSGDFSVKWAVRIDTLSVVMMCVINIVSACVHMYSIGYMSHDPAKGRFMAYLSLFTFAMLMLVTSDNLLQLFFGWEGVGVASYLLIGFWNHKHSANSAAQKAFIVNRVGDFGLALGIMAIFVIFGSIEFDDIFTRTEELKDFTFNFLGYELHGFTVAALLLFVGAVGKSAQLGLHTWLPDAMEGPTPVSALIHAATMVTAGVFLISRMSPLFEYAPTALMVVTVIGALTAFVAATIGLTQFDIKRVIAYSTMSQLGYMFFALGVSAYGAAMFHLMTHAFFKALLFLGAGSVIHAMSDEQDMRKMGGVAKLIPTTYTMMWIGSLALAGIGIPGVFGFAGFYSKDIVLESVWADQTWFGHFAYWMGIAAAVMTAFYSGRLLFMTFHGKPRADEETMHHVHESPPVMLVPLFVLAFGAIFAGYVFYNGFVGSASHHGHHEEGHAITAEHAAEHAEENTGNMEEHVETAATPASEEHSDETSAVDTAAAEAKPSNPKNVHPLQQHQPIANIKEAVDESLKNELGKVTQSLGIGRALRSTPTDPLSTESENLSEDDESLVQKQAEEEIKVIEEIEEKIEILEEKAEESVAMVEEAMEDPEHKTYVTNKEDFWYQSLVVLPENDTVEAAHNVPKWVKLLPLAAGLSGLLLAWLFYIILPGMPAKFVRVFSPLHKLFFNKWFFDELYHALFVKTAFKLGKFFWIMGDKNTIDRLGPDGSAFASLRGARLLSRFQSGYVYQYAFVMMIAVIALTSWFIFKALMVE